MAIDPDTAQVGIGTGLTILGSKDLLLKLLGPSCDYVGERGRSLIEKCDVNLNRIFAAAWQRLGEKLDEPGGVNPRILKHICDDGRFCDDELAAEYFGGLLASSRIEGVEDDSVLHFLNVVKNLPRDQIRLHYLLYASWNEAIRERHLKSDSMQEFRGHQSLLAIRTSELQSEEVNGSQASGKLERAWSGMIHAGLVGSESRFDPLPDGEILFRPTFFGADLFVVVHGLDVESTETFLNEGCLIDDLKIEPCQAAIFSRIPTTDIDSSPQLDRSRMREEIERWAKDNIQVARFS